MFLREDQGNRQILGNGIDQALLFFYGPNKVLLICAIDHEFALQVFVIGLQEIVGLYGELARYASHGISS